MTLLSSINLRLFDLVFKEAKQVMSIYFIKIPYYQPQQFSHMHAAVIIGVWMSWRRLYCLVWFWIVNSRSIDNDVSTLSQCTPVLWDLWVAVTHCLRLWGPGHKGHTPTGAHWLNVLTSGPQSTHCFTSFHLVMCLCTALTCSALYSGSATCCHHT